MYASGKYKCELTLTSTIKRGIQSNSFMTFISTAC